MQPDCCPSFERLEPRILLSADLVDVPSSLGIAPTDPVVCVNVDQAGPEDQDATVPILTIEALPGSETSQTPTEPVDTSLGESDVSLSAQTDAGVTLPTPNPSTWATQPYATGETSIRMRATTAFDRREVEYYFDEISGHPGGTDSGWQASNTYEDTGLSPDTEYTYQVKTRDKWETHNETDCSTACSATTLPDTTPPSPNFSAWAIEPRAASSTSIRMVAVTATDASGVEYYFDEISGNPGGTDSG